MGTVLALDLLKGTSRHPFPVPAGKAMPAPHGTAWCWKASVMPATKGHSRVRMILRHDGTTLAAETNKADCATSVMGNMKKSKERMAENTSEELHGREGELQKVYTVSRCGVVSISACDTAQF